MTEKKALVVLGAGYNRESRLLGVFGMSRVQQAVEEFNKGKYTHLIFCGRYPDDYAKTGKKMPTEARLMWEYAKKLDPTIEKRVKPILEEESRFTAENFEKLEPILRREAIAKAVVITSDVHGERTRLLARQQGFGGKMTFVLAPSQNLIRKELRDSIILAEKEKVKKIKGELALQPKLRKVRPIAQPTTQKRKLAASVTKKASGKRPPIK